MQACVFMAMAIVASATHITLKSQSSFSLDFVCLEFFGRMLCLDLDENKGGYNSQLKKLGMEL